MDRSYPMPITFRRRASFGTICQERMGAGMKTAGASVDLTPYLPRLSARWARESPETTWRVLDGSLVFADISGFTALSERLARLGPIGAEELTEILGQCFAGLLKVAYGEGGNLLKFGGDALLLLFDGPAHELRACRAALGMRTAIGTVGQLTASVGAVRLRMSQGVHSGDLHLFRVGSSHRELIVSGPAATTVVKMESVADAGEIVASPATVDRLGEAARHLVREAKGPGHLLRRKAVADDDSSFEPIEPLGAAAEIGVPLALRRHLLAGGGESEHRNVAVAFVHFDGTDEILAGEGPAVMATALHDLVSVVQAAVEAEDVTFLATDIDADGGKVILAAGAPTALEDDEGRLLRAVRQIADADLRLPLRIGVNRGHVFAGSVGPDYRRTYTVMGDPVNLAARLMAKAEPGQVVVHPSVLTLSRTLFASELLAPFQVKGKAAPVRGLLLGEATGTQEVRLSEIPLVGREDELDAMESAAAAGGHSIDVVGDVGAGKTRLLRELRRRLPGALPAFVVSCEVYEKATPYFATRILLRHLLDVHTDADAGAADLRAAVDTRAPDLVRWLPLLGEVLDLPIEETPATERLQGQFRRERTASTIGELVDIALADGGFIAFEDVHWLDAASAEVVSQLARLVAGRPWTLAVTRRPNSGGFVPVGADVIRLDPLAPTTARSLVAAAAGDHLLPPHRVDELVARADGNPLFLEELVRVAVESDVDDLPDSIESLMAAQIDALTPADRSLVRAAAVLGDRFEASLLAKVVADEHPRLRPADIAVRLAGLLEADGRRLQFRHRLVRDVAYEALPYKRRQSLHARAAEILEDSTKGTTAERAEILSLHHLHAGKYDASVKYAIAAARRARKKYALVEACELYERAVKTMARVPTTTDRFRAEALEELASVRQYLGRFDGAKAAMDEARRYLRSDPVAMARNFSRRAEIASRAGQPDASLRWLLRALRTLDGVTARGAGRERAEILSMCAAIRQQSGRPKEALEFCHMAIEAARAYRSDNALALAYSIHDWAYTALGQPERATRGKRALQLYEKLGRDENVAAMQLNLGAFAYYEGQWDVALDYYTKSRATFEKIGAVVDAALGDCNIAEIFADQGRLDEAETRLQAVITTWQSMDFPVGIALAKRHLGRVELRRGRAAEAEALLSEARATFDDYGLQPKIIEVDTWLAECHLAQGRVERALELLDAGLAAEISSGGSEMRAMIHRLRGYAHLAQGNTEDAWAEIDQSLHVARTRSAAYDVALALEAFAVLAESGGRPLEESARHETAALLADLGVRAAPKPPVALVLA
jgi:class 3 adenylate cyclase/tetratricopeptide (TPR) repeat protein